MRHSRQNFSTRVLVSAVRGALLTLALMPAARAADTAQDPAAAALTQPTNSVEIGAGDVSKGSYKFGEYNGLEKKGGFVNGNIDLRGGGSYDSNDPTRWSVTGTDLGLETRSLDAEYGQQGKFRIKFGYDELLHNISDTYQTPYSGTGSNYLSLPGNWMVPLLPRVNATAPAQGAGGGTNARGLSTTVANSSALVNGVLLAPTAAQLAQSAAIIGADVPDFGNYNIHTKRTNYTGGIDYAYNALWSVEASFRHELKDGTKLMSTVSQYAAEVATVIPDVIHQETDEYKAAINYREGKTFFKASYYGSILHNDVQTMSWQDWGLPSHADTISSAPSNQFHQFSLSGGMNFTPTTRLVADAGYARNTQNQSFYYDPTIMAMALPQSSLQGLIVNESLNLKLTSRPMKSLNLTAAYKFDERDNKTPVSTYMFYDNPTFKGSGSSVFNAPLGLAAGTLATNANIESNRPYSKKLNQVNLDADYTASPANSFKAGYDYQQIHRWCNGTWIDCVDADTTNESTLRAEWRAHISDDFSSKIGYAYSHRTVSNYNEDAFLALVPMANVSPTGAPGGSTAYGTLTALGFTGYGPGIGLNPLPPAGSPQAFFFSNNNALANALYASNNRISELPGMERFNMDNRNRDKVRSMLNWQANDKLSFQAGLDYNSDEYPNAVDGLQSAKSWVLNLDGTYAISEDFVASLFYSYENMHSVSAGNSYTANSTASNVGGNTAITGGCFPTIALRNANNIVDPCLNWSNDMKDKVDTVGANVTRRNLLGGKLDLTGALLYTHSNTDYNPTGGNYANNPLSVTGSPAGTVAAFFIPAQPLPTVSTDLFQLRLSGRYVVSKSSTWRVGYTYARLKVTDYAYDGMQFGGLSGVLPTNELAPNYTVNVVAVSYQYTFR